MVMGFEHAQRHASEHLARRDGCERLVAIAASRARRVGIDPEVLDDLANLFDVSLRDDQEGVAPRFRSELAIPREENPWPRSHGTLDPAALVSAIHPRQSQPARQPAQHRISQKLRGHTPSIALKSESFGDEDPGEDQRAAVHDLCHQVLLS